VLSRWGVLLPEVEEAFRSLHELRNRVIHFDPSTDRNDRLLALEAIQLLTKIITQQFGWLGGQPWFIPNMRGASYLTRRAEEIPFVRRVYIPNCRHVGPDHRIESLENGQLVIVDRDDYEDREVSDDEFRDLLQGG
jgi:hypothetical protein